VKKTRMCRVLGQTADQHHGIQVDVRVQQAECQRRQNTTAKTVWLDIRVVYSQRCRGRADLNAAQP